MDTPSKNEIRILLVDHHQLVRTGVRMLIESVPGMKVVGKASNRSEALALAASKKPNVILLEIDLGAEDGLDLLPELRETAKDARVLILTGVKEIETHRRAARMGAAGLVLKEHTSDVLLKAIKKVHQGEVWLDRSMMSILLNEMTAPEDVDPDTLRIAGLTDREQGVIALIAEGLKNKQIAERLFISETTVTHHLSSIFSKLGVSDRLELVIYAFAHKLAKMPK
jgi:two-component system, NarL family, nitrate/nitrite response regulator NarL